MVYRPRPLATSDVELPEEWYTLREKLARHVHDIWASKRLAEGWRYGPYRDDREKTHPGLVEFDALSESEKEYDRATASETLKAIIASGWRLKPGR